MGIFILFGSLGAAPVSSWLWECTWAPSPLLPRSHINLQRSHPGPFAFGAGSRLPAQPGAGLHLCHSLWLSEVSISQQPTFRPLQKHQTLHNPGVTQQLSTTKKSRSLSKHPNALAALRGTALCSPPHPQDNLFLLRLLSTQLQRRYVEIKMQSNKDAALLGRDKLRSGKASQSSKSCSTAQARLEPGSQRSPRWLLAL